MELPKYYERKHVFAVIAIIIAVSTPFAVGLFPFIINDFLYTTKETWFIQIPKETYVLYAIAFVMWFFASTLVSLFNVTKSSIIIGVFLIILSIVPIVIGANHFKQVGSNGITFSELTTLEHQYYEWNQVEQVNYHLSKEKGERSILEILFVDGSTLSLTRDADFVARYSWFMDKLNENGIKIFGDQS